MRILFGIFVFGILSSTAMAELVCTRINGCELFPNAKTESEYCPACVNTSEEVKSISEAPKSDIDICKWGYKVCRVKWVKTRNCNLCLISKDESK